MTVIDFHVHLADARYLKPEIMAFMRENNPGYCRHFGDGPHPEGIVAYFAAQGVTRAVMLAEYAPKATGVVSNEAIAGFCRDHQELIPFASISLEADASYLDQARHAVEVLGMKGFKLHPGVGYMPYDPCCFWIYEKAREWNIPIMIHTGGAPSTRLNWEYSRPLHSASAAALYPEVDFIFAHCGDYGWWQEAIQAAMWMPNVYVDLSLWQDPYVRLPKPRFYQWLRDIIDLAGAGVVAVVPFAHHHTVVPREPGMGGVQHDDRRGVIDRPHDVKRVACAGSQRIALDGGHGQCASDTGECLHRGS